MKLTKTAVILALSAVTTIARAGEIQPYDQAEFDKLTAAGKPVLLVIHADWCPTCRAQEPIIENAMKQTIYKDVTTLNVNFDTSKPLLKRYKVGMKSTLIAFKGLKEVGRSIGDASKDGIENLVNKAVN